MTPTLDGLGLRIRTARHDRGLSAAEVAVAITRTVDTIYQWEQGKSVPPLADALALVALFGCDLAWMLTGVPTAARPMREAVA